MTNHTRGETTLTPIPADIDGLIVFSDPNLSAPLATAEIAGNGDFAGVITLDDGRNIAITVATIDGQVEATCWWT